jgi:hypothetical protein
LLERGHVGREGLGGKARQRVRINPARPPFLPTSSFSVSMSETASPLARTNTTSSIASSVTSSHRGGILLNPSDRASSSLGFAARSSSPAFSESPSHRHHINFAPLPKAEFDDGRPRRSSISIGVLSRSQMIKSQGGRKPKQGEVRVSQHVSSLYAELWN